MDKECQDVPTKLTPVMKSLPQSQYSIVKRVEDKTSLSNDSEDAGYGSKRESSSCVRDRPTQQKSQDPVVSIFDRLSNLMYH